MIYKVIGPDGRVKMSTCSLQYVRAEEYKSQRAAGCSFEVEDATPEQLEEIARRGVKVKVKGGKRKCST